MSQFVYVLKVTRLAMLTEAPTDEEAEVLGAHLEYLERLSAEGTVLLAGRTQTADEDTFGLVILEAESEAEARSIMASDPAVQHKVMSAELYPYRVAVVSPSLVAPPSSTGA